MMTFQILGFSGYFENTCIQTAQRDRQLRDRRTAKQTRD
jgi:hypothetical protein